MRGWIPACLMACLLALLLAIAAPDVKASGAAARLSDATGLVEVLPGGAESAWRAAEAGEELQSGARIRTGADGSARLALAGGVSVELGPATEAALGGEETGEQKIELAAGRVLLRTGQPLRDARVAVMLRRAAVVTTGTALVLEETGERSAVMVLEGDAGFTPSGGRTVLVMAGETVSAGADVTSNEVTRFDTEAEAAHWSRQAPAEGEKDGSMAGLAAIFAGALVLFLVGGIGFAVLYYRVVTRLRGR